MLPRLPKGDRWLPALLIAIVTGYAALTRPPGLRLADLDVYLGAVTGLSHGQSLYDFILGNAPFTYPPFAGLLMVPLTGVPKPALQLLWTLATITTVILIGQLTGRNKPLIALALFLSAPVASDLRYGQVSLFLSLLILVDVQRAPPRAQGILIGLAAAIKLTPLIFIPMLWLGGRRRAALTATATFLACGATAALILPSDSWRYWTTEVRDVNRLGFIDSIGNQSLNGALIRLDILPPARPLLALFAGGLIALIALYRARKLAQTGDWPAATIVVGAASIVLSPVSWTHHQIWLILAAFLARDAAAKAIGLAVMILPVTAVWGEVRLLWAIAVAVAITYGTPRTPPIRYAPPRFVIEKGPPMTRVPRGINIASLLMGAAAVTALAMTVAALIAWRHLGPASELYRKYATGTPDDIETAIANVRGPIVFGGLSTLLTLVLFGRMAFAVRVPKRPWVRPALWVGAVICVFLLVVGLNGGLDDNSESGFRTAGSVKALIGDGLAPDWYPILNATLGVLTLILIVVATVALSRSSLVDYYRKESWQSDDHWTGFVARQNGERG